MKKGFDTTAAMPPAIAARPNDCTHLSAGDTSCPRPIACFAAAYVPKRTETLENCQKHAGPKPRCKPRKPSARPI
eukprot:CAMPEP_0117583204 /NCGR_PEP_ID=MMETSP0784-20121206/66878_1 /TAXON_ID=39447 /ORGANISM="" /LENGTH=74 /DNA_ID=CAMNT_0005383851 /DNA_START=574 /DNA_END=798 /DNA_ORIENTATION=+